VENAELILNLWYVFDDTGLVYSLRARCYVGSGDDEAKLALLRRFAQIDYLIAQPFPVPERFHTTIVEGNTQKKVPVVHLTSLEPFGGPQVLFEEAFVALERQLPAQTDLSIGQQPLLCITPLLADDNGKIKPSFKSRTKFGPEETR
jgi:hypothetical protein